MSKVQSSQQCNKTGTQASNPQKTSGVLVSTSCSKLEDFHTQPAFAVEQGLLSVEANLEKRFARVIAI